MTFSVRWPCPWDGRLGWDHWHKPFWGLGVQGQRVLFPDNALGYLASIWVPTLMWVVMLMRHCEIKANNQGRGPLNGWTSNSRWMHQCCHAYQEQDHSLTSKLDKNENMLCHLSSVHCTLKVNKRLDKKKTVVSSGLCEAHFNLTECGLVTLGPQELNIVSMKFSNATAQ